MYHCTWSTWLPEVTSRDPEGVSLRRVRACTTGIYAISTPSGAFSLEVTSSNVTWLQRGSLGKVRTCATGSCAIFALVGPFDRKWRHQTSPVGLQLENMRARMRDRKCPWGALYDIRVLLSSPFTGYLPLSRHSISIITFLTKVCCFRICCVVLQVVHHVHAAFLLYIQRSWRFLIPSFFSVFIQHLNHYFVDLL